MKPQISTFKIVREDQAVDPVTLMTEALSIGRMPDCELSLNHPTVSRMHAGIKEVNGRFYIFQLSPSNSTTLNGRLVEEKEALADGDIAQIGPFFIYVGHDGAALTLRVIYQTAVRIGDTEVQGEGADEPHAAAATAHAAAADEHVDAALEVFWEKRKREAGKITRPSPLRPHAPPRLGKARFNWTPTRDLVRPWPFAIFTWAAIVVGLLTVAAAFTYTNAFSPAPISNPHTRTALALTPAIAKEPNGNTCTSCHAIKTSMNESCAACHQTQAFAATVTPPHKAAGINCTNCHTEHKGADFRPGLQPMSVSFQPQVDTTQTCAGCHNDANKQLYNGKAVHTPHGGTFGYPVNAGQWVWTGMAQDELAQKQADFMTRLAQYEKLWPGRDANQVRNAQFHALHVGRLRAVSGLQGDPDGSVSCSTCHTSWAGAALDRATPRTTCAACHNGYTDPVTKSTVITQDKPNCNSCHIQHVEDKRPWNPSLFTRPPQVADVNLAPAHNAGLFISSAR